MKWLQVKILSFCRENKRIVNYVNVTTSVESGQLTAGRYSPRHHQFLLLHGIIIKRLPAWFSTELVKSDQICNEMRDEGCLLSELRINKLLGIFLFALTVLVCWSVAVLTCCLTVCSYYDCPHQRLQTEVMLVLSPPASLSL